MTKANNDRLLSDLGSRQVRLVVPREHNSARSRSATSSMTSLAAAVVTDRQTPKVKLPSKSYARARNRSGAGSAIKQLTSHSIETIQPLNLATTMVADQVVSKLTDISASPKAKVATFKPTIPIYSRQAVLPKAKPTAQQVVTSSGSAVKVSGRNLSNQPARSKLAKVADQGGRQAILRQAAQIRQQAKLQAEAAVRRAAAQPQPKAPILSKGKKSSFTSVIAKLAKPLAVTSGARAAATITQPAAVAVAPATIKVTQTALSDRTVSADSAGAIALQQPTNLLQRMAAAKITFSFKVNKQRVLTILRYLTVAIIIVASAYLAWDTYTTNESVKNSFKGSNSASAMSIAGTNPVTADQTAISQEQRAAYTVPSDQPRFINIPTIGVNARVMSVGVNSRGNIDTPTNLNDTAWYDGSAKPGQDGQVFIDGHSSFSNTINAAFNELVKLKPGDQIIIEKGNGEKVNYRVTQVETEEADKVDMGKALNPPTGTKKGLTLMTCTGTFNYRTQTADKRLTVYAAQEEV